MLIILSALRGQTLWSQQCSMPHYGVMAWEFLRDSAVWDRVMSDIAAHCCKTMYHYYFGNVPNIFDVLCEKELTSWQNTSEPNDVHARFLSIDVSIYRLRIHVATTWNDIPMCMKYANTVNVFKQVFKHIWLIRKCMSLLGISYGATCLLLDWNNAHQSYIVWERGWLLVVTTV